MQVKSIKRVLPFLPRFVRDRLLISQVELPYDETGGLVFKVADSPLELEQAFKLVYKNYLKLGYCLENPYELRATLHHALPSSSVLIAKEKDSVVGTLTVVRDNPFQLPLEKEFSISHLRNNGRRLAEITSLVIHPDYRRQDGGTVLFPLLKLMYLYCVDFFGAQTLVIAIHPKDRFFYESIMRFERLKDGYAPDYLGAPAQTMVLHLDRAQEEYRSFFSRFPDKQNLYKFFVESDLEAIHLPDRQYYHINDPLIDSEAFEKLFVQKLRFEQVYGAQTVEEIRALLREPPQASRPPRVEVHAPVRLYDHTRNQIYTGTIKDASMFGLRVCLNDDSVQDITEVSVHIEVGPKKFAKLRCRKAWQSPQRGIGFTILHSDSEWRRLNDYLLRLHFSRYAQQKTGSNSS